MRQRTLEHVISSLTLTEIAERMTIPVGTARIRIRLGMLKLREVLAAMVANGGVF